MRTFTFYPRGIYFGNRPPHILENKISDNVKSLRVKNRPKIHRHYSCFIFFHLTCFKIYLNYCSKAFLRKQKSIFVPNYQFPVWNFYVIKKTSTKYLVPFQFFYDLKFFFLKIAVCEVWRGITDWIKVGIPDFPRVLSGLKVWGELIEMSNSKIFNCIRNSLFLEMMTFCWYFYCEMMLNIFL